MSPQDQLTLSLLTASAVQQNQMLRNTDAMLRELMDRVDSVGDLLWRMDRRHRLTASPVDPTTKRKRAAKKRHLARKQSAARKRSGKQA